MDGMDGWMEWTDGQMDRQTDGWTDGWMNGWINEKASKQGHQRSKKGKQLASFL